MTNTVTNLVTPLHKLCYHRNRCQRGRSLAMSLSKRHRYSSRYKLLAVARRRQLVSSKYSSVSRSGQGNRHRHRPSSVPIIIDEDDRTRPARARIRLIKCTSEAVLIGCQQGRICLREKCIVSPLS